MKKIFVALISLTLIFTMIPSITFAQTNVSQWWTDRNGLAEVGNFILERESIEIGFSDYNVQGNITAIAEIKLVKDNEYLGKNAGDIYDISDCQNNQARLEIPIAVIIDEIISNEAEHKVTFKMTELDSLGGRINREKYSAISEGHSIGYLVNYSAEKDLSVNMHFFDDERCTVPFTKNGVSVDIRDVIEKKESNEGPVNAKDYLAPVGCKISSCTFDKDSNTINIKLFKKTTSLELDKVYMDTYYNDQYDALSNITNYMSRDLEIIYNIYEDKSLTKLITDPAYTYSQVVKGGEYSGQRNYKFPQSLKVGDVIDKTIEEGKLIIKFYPSIEDLSKDRVNVFNRFKEKANIELGTVLGQSYEIKLADPDKMGINGYNREEASKYLVDQALALKHLDIPFMLEDEIEGNSFDNWCVLHLNLYKNEELTELWDRNSSLEENTDYYILPSYTITVYENSRDYVTEEVYSKKPCKVRFQFVEPEKEITNQIQSIEKMDFNLIDEGWDGAFDLILEDLAWINVLANSSLDAFLPPVSNPKAFLEKQNKGVYEKLVGNTKLDIDIIFGMAGDGGSGSFGKDTHLDLFYYKDDVYYGKYQGNGTIFTRNVLYVPEGTTDRAQVAEKRITDYLKGKDLSAKVQEFSMDSFIEFVKENYELNDYCQFVDEIKALYMIDGVIAAYSHESETTQEYFLGLIGPLLASQDIFDSNKLETVGTIDYMIDDLGNEYRNITAYKPYKVTFTDNVRNKTKDFLYVISIGTEAQLKEPYADWTDEDTSIKIEGQNGYVPFDAYTKIKVINGGREIKFIQDKVGSDKTVHAYDINAYTNFKGGKLEDLGKGLMKVMIPLGVLSEDGVKAHYVDDQGNVQDLQYTIEEVDGKKYVCFITNHFSTYAISGVSTEGDSKTDLSETPKTGDTSGLARWAMLAALAAGTAVFAKRRRED